MLFKKARTTSVLQKTLDQDQCDMQANENPSSGGPGCCKMSPRDPWALFGRLQEPQMNPRFQSRAKNETK